MDLGHFCDEDVLQVGAVRAAADTGFVGPAQVDELVAVAVVSAGKFVVDPGAVLPPLHLPASGSRDETGNGRKIAWSVRSLARGSPALCHRVHGMVSVDASAWVAPTAVLTGEVHVGPGSRILHGTVLNGDRGPVHVGQDVLVMENAVLRGRPEHPLELGDAVLVGPQAHLNGTSVEDEVFIATGVSMFPGSRAGSGCELRINSVLHVNSHLEPGTVVPIGWIAAGRPAQLFSPDRHDELWATQEPLDFPGTVYGVPRGTSMREIMRRQCELYGPG